MLKILRTTIQN